VAAITLTCFGRCGCGARLRVFDHPVGRVLSRPGVRLPEGPDDDEGVIAEADGSFECPRCGAHGKVVDRAVVSPA
jgi:hypothetical protein